MRLYMSFCIWLLSFSMFLRYIHLVSDIMFPFLFRVEYHSIAGIYTIFYTLFINGHLDYFFLLIVVNSATMSILVQIFV